MLASAYNTNEPTTKIAFCIWVLPTRTLDRGPKSKHGVHVKSDSGSLKRSLWAACWPTTGIQRPKWSNERQHWCTLVCETRQRSGAKEAERSAGEGTGCWLPGGADRRRALRSRAGASRRRSLAAERTHGRQGRKKTTQKKNKKRSVSSERASLNGLVNLHSDGLYVTLGLGGSSELCPRESRRSLVYHTRLEAAAQRCKCLRSLQKIKNNKKKQKWQALIRAQRLFLTLFFEACVVSLV